MDQILTFITGEDNDCLRSTTERILDLISGLIFFVEIFLALATGIFVEHQRGCMRFLECHVQSVDRRCTANPWNISDATRNISLMLDFSASQAKLVSGICGEAVPIAITYTPALFLVPFLLTAIRRMKYRFSYSQEQVVKKFKALPFDETKKLVDGASSTIDIPPTNGPVDENEAKRNEIVSLLEALSKESLFIHEVCLWLLRLIISGVCFGWLSYYLYQFYEFAYFKCPQPGYDTERDVIVKCTLSKSAAQHVWYAILDVYLGLYFLIELIGFRHWCVIGSYCRCCWRELSVNEKLMIRGNRQFLLRLRCDRGRVTVTRDRVRHDTAERDDKAELPMFVRSQEADTGTK